MQQPSPSPPPSTSKGRTARELTERGAVLLDVRTPEEFHAEHVTGAVNIPLQEIPARLAELGPKERAVVVYCRSGRRSAEAAGLLRQRGFRHVHDMGAMLEWTNDDSTAISNTCADANPS